jgi:peptidoglycan hydrolase CwlO-like protein
MIARPLVLSFLLFILASPSFVQAQSMGDSLLGAANAKADEATQAANDQLDEANGQIDDAKTKVDEANAKVDEVSAEANAQADAAKMGAIGAKGSMSETAKRAAGKGVHTATDSAVGGASMSDSAKSGGDAALKEAMGSSPTE